MGLKTTFFATSTDQAGTFFSAKIPPKCRQCQKHPKPTKNLVEIESNPK